MEPSPREQAVEVPTGAANLQGDLTVPGSPHGLVLFAHGSGSSRKSGRNRHVARLLNEAGFATLLFDLLTLDEEAVDARTAHLRFDIGLLAGRLVDATDWAATQPELSGLPIGYFGASTGGGAAIVAAAVRPDSVGAVVSRGGRPDLAGEALGRVQAPTLLIVGGRDEVVIGLNEQARDQMQNPVELAIVPGASHLFEEPGTLDQVADLAIDWFARHLAPASA